MNSKEKTKVLVLVTDPWRSDTSGGNTIDNFFSGMKDIEFAHLYCRDGLPDNKTCTRYYQISESEVLKKFIFHQKVGHSFVWEEGSSLESERHKDKVTILNKFIGNLKKARPNILLTFQKILWSCSNWKTPELRAFITDFCPDVVYAPCYASPFQLALTRYVKELTGKRIITWSADDNYSLRQFSLSIFYWINRFWDRMCLRKTYPYYDSFYSVSEDEVIELQPIIKKPMRILRKGVSLPDKFCPREIHRPIKFIYAGNLYGNRDKVLVKIADTLKRANSKEVKAELHIYTGSKLKSKIYKELNDCRSVYHHGMVTPKELSELYQNSDIAIHCESFRLKDRLETRLSFSTKIIDCFQSGCAIVAIAWEEHAALKYLRKEDAAICVTSENDIDKSIKTVINTPSLIMDYSQKAFKCAKANHDIEKIQAMLYADFIKS